MDWGMKLILAGTLTPAQYLGYQFQILKVGAAASPRGGAARVIAAQGRGRARGYAHGK